jgi:hypothetical protein
MIRALWSFVMLLWMVPASAQAPAGTSKAEFKTFISQDGGFSILLPSRPKVIT